ncbi:MAG: hypothetical protein KJ571_07700 [Bacteroidetes bacterium]|nr:hypothetical protein [Bacteroidota bacterium]
MKILIIFILFMYAPLEIISENKEDYNNLPVLEKIRFVYYEAVENENKIEELEKIIVNNYSTDQTNYPSIILAYWGAVDALKAKHAFWPFTKLSLLNKSMELMGEALNKSPDDLEIRFMRFSILHFIPSILGYGEERDRDMEKITELIENNNTGSLDPSIQKGIIEFLIESGRLNIKQENLMQEKLAFYKNYE